MNLKLKSFIVIVDLVACSLEKMLSDKIKIQIIFFFKKKISNICTNTIHVACHCVIFISQILLVISMVKTLNKSEENPTGHLRQIQPFKTLTYDIVIMAFNNYNVNHLYKTY